MEVPLTIPKAESRRRVMTTHLPPHPIEGTAAYKTYITRPGLRGAATLTRALTRFFREMTPIRLENVTVIQINQVLDRLSAKGYNPSYTDKLFRRASAFFAWCRQLGYIESNEFKATAPARVDSIFIPTLIPVEDVKALHGHILGRGVVDEIILWGAMRMGARISEPCMATVGDALNNKTVDEFMADKRVVFKTKTQARLAMQPRFTLPAYKALLTKRFEEPDSPLLYLKGVSLVRPDGRGGTQPNIEARVLIARTWFAAMQKELWGEYRYTPKAMRSTFISRELMADPDSMLAVAMQCGNSMAVIQKNYLNYINLPEFASGE